MVQIKSCFVGKHVVIICFPISSPRRIERDRDAKMYILYILCKNAKEWGGIHFINVNQLMLHMQFIFANNSTDYIRYVFTYRF
jgi:hypothetical protein